MLAWLAFRFSHWPADGKRTYGFERLQMLVAFGNGLLLFIIAGGIVVEAARRLMAPVPVLGGTMLVIAAIGLLVERRHVPAAARRRPSRISTCAAR